MYNNIFYTFIIYNLIYFFINDLDGIYSYIFKFTFYNKNSVKIILLIIFYYFKQFFLYIETEII